MTKRFPFGCCELWIIYYISRGFIISYLFIAIYLIPNLAKLLVLKILKQLSTSLTNVYVKFIGTFVMLNLLFLFYTWFRATEYCRLGKICDIKDAVGGFGLKPL